MVLFWGHSLGLWMRLASTAAHKVKLHLDTAIPQGHHFVSQLLHIRPSPHSHTWKKPAEDDPREPPDTQEGEVGEAPDSALACPSTKAATWWMNWRIFSCVCLSLCNSDFHNKYFLKYPRGYKHVCVITITIKRWMGTSMKNNKSNIY